MHRKKKFRRKSNKNEAEYIHKHEFLDLVNQTQGDLVELDQINRDVDM